MEQIEIILRTTDPTGKVTEQLLAKFDTEKPATESDEVRQRVMRFLSIPDSVLTRSATRHLIRGKKFL